MKLLRVKYETSFGSSQRRGDLPAPWSAELWLWDAPWVWGLAPPPFVLCWEAPPSIAVLWSWWCGLSGLGRNLLWFLSCFLWTHCTFSRYGAAPADQTSNAQQCLLRKRSGFDAKSMMWTLKLPTGGQEQYLNIHTGWASRKSPGEAVMMALQCQCWSVHRHRCAGVCWLTDLLFVLLDWPFVVLPGGFLVLWVAVWTI